MKGLTKEEQAARPDLVEELAARIDEISDGITGNLQNPRWGGKAGASKSMEIRVDTMHPGKDFVHELEIIVAISKVSLFCLLLRK